MTTLNRAITALVVMVIAGVVALRLGAPDRLNSLLASVGAGPAASTASMAASPATADGATTH